MDVVEYEETTQSPGSMSRSKIKFHSPLADGSNATSNRKGSASSWEDARLPSVIKNTKPSTKHTEFDMNGMAAKTGPFRARRGGKTPLNIPSNMLVVKA